MNFGGDGAMLAGPGKKRNLGRLALIALLGISIVLLCFRVHRVLGYAAMIILPLLAIRRLEKGYHRLLWTVYLVFVITLISSAAIQSSFEKRGDASNLITRLLLGGPPEYRTIVSILLGLLIGLLIVSVPLLSIIWVSSDFVLALYEVFGVSRRTAFRYLWSLIMGIQLPWEIVENGEVKRTKHAGILDIIGGPGVVVVRAGNAVVFDWGGKITRIEGPGVWKTKAFERAKHVVELGPQWVTTKVETVLTKDRIPLTFEMGVGYQVEPQQLTESRLKDVVGPKHFDGVIGGIFPVQRESVFKAVYNTGMVRLPEIVKATAESVLRDAVFQYSLDELYDYSVNADTGRVRDLKPRPQTIDLIIDNIATQVRDKLADTALDWGVQITAAHIDTVEMPQEMRDRVIQWWETVWDQRRLIAEAKGEKVAKVERGRGEAAAIAYAERARATATNQMLVDLLAMLHPIAAVQTTEQLKQLLSFLERITIGLMSDRAATLRYLEAATKQLESGEAPGVIIAGPPPATPGNK